MRIFYLLVIAWLELMVAEDRRQGRRRNVKKRRSIENEKKLIAKAEQAMALSDSVSKQALDTYCTGKRKSSDVIIYLGQKQHSSYDATHANTLNASMASLRKNMLKIAESDVIVWHEGDLRPSDANALQGVANVRFCLLTNATGWEVPKFIDVDSLPPMPWSLGYRQMIRFYAITVWPTLKNLGYEWVMRMDDDSFILSPVSYNIFDHMRATGDLYAYRMLSAECPQTFGDFIKKFSTSPTASRQPQNTAFEMDKAMRKSNMDTEFVSHCLKFPRHCRSQLKRDTLRNELSKLNLDDSPQLLLLAVSRGLPYCAAIGQYGYYNNWFITKIDWWLSEPQVVAMIRAFDQSKLIFTHRSNDLIFQTAVIRLFMPPERRSRFIDFTYQHHTTRHGAVVFGGIESGTTDPDAKQRIRAYAQKYGGSPLPCHVQNRYKAKSQRIFYAVPGGKTSTAPYCSPEGTMDFI